MKDLKFFFLGEGSENWPWSRVIVPKGSLEGSAPKIAREGSTPKIANNANIFDKLFFKPFYFMAWKLIPIFMI